jgi:hypothetical protein
MFILSTGGGRGFVSAASSILRVVGLDLKIGEQKRLAGRRGAPPCGSAVTKTLFKCARVLVSLNLSTHRLCVSS